MKHNKKIGQKIDFGSDNLVICKEKNGIATLTLNRPKKFNSLSEEMITVIQKILEEIAKNKSIKIVIIQGAGKSFCAGHDLKEMIDTREENYYKSLFLKCSKMMMTINQIPQPVIAKVHGIATAAGCQLVAACDLAVASSDARFATSGVNIGLFCSTPAVPISRNISRKRAMELLLTGEFIDSNEALNWGLINRVTSLEKLDQEVEILVNTILSKPTVAIFTGKKMFYKQLERNTEEAYAYASKIMACNMMAEEVDDGVKTFFKKK
tara:strand:+ start:221 stop:1018 length:798 start_codon:yes stop_codon:yes gene_type:complete